MATEKEPIDINGAPSSAPRPTVMQMPAGRAVPSLVPIPHQIAVTVCWVALGVGIGYYLCHRASHPRRGRID